MSSLPASSQQMVDGIPDCELKDAIAQLNDRLQRSTRRSNASGVSVGSGYGNGDGGRMRPQQSLQHRRSVYTKPVAAPPGHEHSVRGAIQFGIAGGVLLGARFVSDTQVTWQGMSPWTVKTVAFFGFFLVGFVFVGALSYKCLREDEEVGPKLRAALETVTVLGLFFANMYTLLICIKLADSKYRLESGLSACSAGPLFSSLMCFSQTMYTNVYVVTPILFALLCWNNIDWVR
jgi:hypothetical protein